jgi:hypothetical protein
MGSDLGAELTCVVGFSVPFLISLLSGRVAFEDRAVEFGLWSIENLEYNGV